MQSRMVPSITAWQVDLQKLGGNANLPDSTDAPGSSPPVLKSIAGESDQNSKVRMQPADLAVHNKLRKIVYAKPSFSSCF